MLSTNIYHIDSNNYYYNIPVDYVGIDNEKVINNITPINCLTADGKGVNLIDNNLKFYVNGNYIGLYYATPSNSNCVLSETINFQFGVESQGPHPSNITFVFSDDCCGKIDIFYYKGYSVIGHNTYLNPGKIVQFDAPIGTTDSMITIKKTVLPRQCIKIEGIIFGTINVFNKFKKHNLIEEINVLSDDLPINQFEATIVNPNHIEISKKDPLNVFSNNRYYGSFYVKKVQRIANNLYDIVAQNAISILDSEPYNFWSSSVSNLIYAGSSPIKAGIIETIKSSTGITIEAPKNADWYVYSGDLKLPTCRMVLCAVGFASGFIVNSSRRNDISLIPIPTEITSVISTNSRRIIGDAVFNKNDEISSATIKYTGVGTGEHIVSESITIDAVSGQQNIYVFDSPVSVSSISDSTIVYKNLYSVCFIPNANITSVTIKYDVVYKTTSEETVTNENTTTTNTKTFDQLAIKGFYNESASALGYDNISRAADVEKYIKSRGKVIAKIRLRNECVGDLIKIETAWDGIITGIITKMDITFGYEDIANIEVLEWNS